MAAKRNYQQSYYKVKEALFSECFHAHERYQELFKEEGFAETTYAEKIRRLAEFSALYTVIEKAGLEDHYQAWKEANDIDNLPIQL